MIICSQKASILSELRSDRSGATAILYALLLAPMLGIIALAIDYSRLKREENVEQVSADAASLATASLKSGDSNVTDAQAIAAGKVTFKANYEELGRGAMAGEPTITIVEQTVTVSYKRSLGTYFLGLFGRPHMEVGVTSVAFIKKPLKLEVVLVLDYSGSMNSNGKYQAMRDAAIDLVEELSLEVNNAGNKFALVPFSKHVYATLPSDYVVGQPAGGTWTNCTRDRQYPYNTEDSTPLISDNETKWISDAPEDNNGTGSAPCHNYTSRDLVVLPLTEDKNPVISQLNSMTPYSWTHIALGMEMGWHVLSPNLPFDEGAPYTDDEVHKVVVLLSDGVQTAGGNGPGGANSVGHAQDNLEVVCDSAKAQGITIVTIGFDLATQAAKDPLIYCASSEDDFYDAADNTQLAASFNEITARLAGEVRLTH